MGNGRARFYNLLSLVFVTLAIVWAIVVVVLLVSG